MLALWITLNRLKLLYCFILSYLYVSYVLIANINRDVDITRTYALSQLIIYS